MENSSETTIPTDDPEASSPCLLVPQHQGALDYDLRRRIVNFLANCRVGAPLVFEVRDGVVRIEDHFRTAEERSWFAETCRRHGATRVEIEPQRPPG